MLIIFGTFVLGMRLIKKTKKEKTYNSYCKIYGIYNNLKSYISKIDVLVTSNLSSRNYCLKEYYKSPDKYRIDCVSPDEIKNLKYIFKRDEVVFFSPFSSEPITLNTIPVEKNCMFLGDFFKSYYETQTGIAKTNKKTTNELVYETDVVRGCKRHFCQKLWFDKKTQLPLRLVTYDVNDKEVIRVEYTDFKLNENINDETFENF
jgi:outer membrane lipoprotein-sorting protein